MKLFALVLIGCLSINLNIYGETMEKLDTQIRHANESSFFTGKAKQLLDWNKEKLTSQANLSMENIAELFAPEFIVIANGKKHQANYKNYYEFLNQFRSNIASLDHNVQEYINMESTVVMPLTAKLKRLDGKEDIFDAIMLIKFNNEGKIVHWQEVYSIR